MQKKCKHENNPVDTHLIRETIGTQGLRLIARRQCCVCNQTLEEGRQLTQEELASDAGIQVFFDWDSQTWEPISQRAAYEARRAAQIAPPPPAVASSDSSGS